MVDRPPPPTSADLRLARLIRGLTQAEMAKEMHVSRSTLSRWESGKVRIPAWTRWFFSDHARKPRRD